MFGADDSLSDDERAGRIVERLRILLAAAGNDAEVLQVDADVMAVRSFQPLAQRERPLIVILGSRRILLLHVDQPEIVQAGI